MNQLKFAQQKFRLFRKCIEKFSKGKLNFNFNLMNSLVSQIIWKVSSIKYKEQKWV